MGNAIPDIETCNMSFLHDYALDKNRILTEEEITTINLAHEALKQADEIIAYLGGKAGRLGETVVGTGLLEGILQAMSLAGKESTPVSVMIDKGASELFDEKLYQEKYWPEISIEATPQLLDLKDASMAEKTDKNLLILDLHGGSDGMPYLQIEAAPQNKQDGTGQVTTLGQLFRVGMRSYARRGQERRYADFVEELFALPQGSIDGTQVQPNILLSAEDNARYPQLAQELGLDPQALTIICFFQSVVPAKCYERWDEVLQLLSNYFAQHFPQQKLDFLLACGPDEDLPEGFKKADIEEWLQDFTGVNNNARVLVRMIASLRDLAIVANHAKLALSNDSGPGHITGASGTPTIIPFLPGNIYAKHIWSSTLWHYGVTLDPNPYSYQQLESAVIWGRTHIINSIEPELLVAEILNHLPESFRQQ